MAIVEKLIELYHPLGRHEHICASLVSTCFGNQILVKKIASSKSMSSMISVIDYYIPAIINAFGESIDEVDIIYIKPPEDDSQDAEFFNICFAREIFRRSIDDKIFTYVKMLNPSYTPLHKPLAFKLQDAGIQMSKYIGEYVVLRTASQGDIKGRVYAYDGTRYIIQQNGVDYALLIGGTIRTPSPIR